MIYTTIYRKTYQVWMRRPQCIQLEEREDTQYHVPEYMATNTL